MRTYIFLWILVFSFLNITAKNRNKNEKITVAAYYFPDYHTGDNRNSLLKGPGWSEWELVKNARPRFEGHNQPNVPAWGYTDEKSPAVMAQKISAAANHGIDAFIFDWYFYNDGPFLNKCLDDGFLKAKNNSRIKFGLMWANHDWLDIHPYTHGIPYKKLYDGKVTPETFAKICEVLVNTYFKQENYWLIDGKPYFSIYDIQKFIESFGSFEKAKNAMTMLENKAKSAGLKGVHWNIVTWGNPVLPGENSPANMAEIIRSLGFNSATSYVWVHHCALNKRENDYNRALDEYLRFWQKAKNEFEVPYFPNVTMGWDSSPRTNQEKAWDFSYGYPYSGIMVNNTPENFKKALLEIKNRMLANPDGPRVMNINCWNEWTEGSYLEPDVKNGMKYLKAVKSVFK